MHRRFAKSWTAALAALVVIGLFASSPVQAWENSAGEVEQLHRLTTKYQTPHIKWAQPYAGGKLRVLYFIASPFQGMGTHAREAVELMQRFDVEVDTVFYYRFYSEAWFGGVAGTRRIHRLLRDRQYDLFIFQDISPDKLPTWPDGGGYELLGPAIRQGAGVVLIGTDSEQLLAERKQAQPTRFIEPAQTLQLATFGEGRIVTMPPRPTIEYRPGWRMDYEIWQQRLGRALLWAAQREPAASVKIDVAATVSRDELADHPIVVQWTFDTPPNDGGEAYCELTLRREDGWTVDLSRVDITAPDRQGGEAVVALPKLRGGTYHIDAILRVSAATEPASAQRQVASADDATVVHTWDTATFTVAAPQSISVSLDQSWSEVGGELTGKISLEGAAPAQGQAVVMCLLDRRGRILVRRHIDVDPDTREIPLRFAVAPWMPMLLRVEAVLTDAAGEVVADWRFFQVTKRHRDRFNFVLWDFPNGQTLAPYAAETMQRLGVTAITSARAAEPVAAAYELAWVPMTGGQISSAKANDWHNEQATRFFLGRMDESRGHGVLTYSLGDEGAVEGAGTNDQAMVAYRRYLEQQYGDIAALNDHWDESYASFDEVALLDPADGDEQAARDAGNYPRWYDRQAFKSVNFVDFAMRHLDDLRANDPEAYLGFEGSGRFARRGDAELISRNLQFWVPYGSTLDELVRSLTTGRPHFILGNWMGYHRTFEGVNNKYWRMVVNGSTSAWWWMWSTIGAWQGLIDSDLGAMDYIEQMADDTRIVRDGLGALLIESTIQHDGIAMLYSKPSSFAVTIDAHLSYGDYEPNHQAAITVIHDQPVQFQYVTDRMLDAGELDGGPYQVLVLPQALAIGEAEAQTIRQFVEHGGTVIADVRPGVYNNHLKPRDRPILDDLFGITGQVRQPAQKAAVAIDGAIDHVKLNLEWSDAIVDPGVRLVPDSGAIALGHAGEVPVCIVRDVGEGRVILLNMAMSSFPARQTARNLRTWGTADETPPEVARFFAALFAAADVEPTVALQRYKAKDPYIGNVKVQRWRNGQIEILALHREVGAREQAFSVLPQPRHVYDLRAGVYLGEVDRWMNQLEPARASFFALLPRRCPAPHVVMPEQARRGTQVDVHLSVPGAAGKHALKLTATDPFGMSAPFWDQVVVADDEPVTVTLPIAYNDPPGQWRITVTDVYTTETRHTLPLDIH